MIKALLKHIRVIAIILAAMLIGVKVFANEAVANPVKVIKLKSYTNIAKPVITSTSSPNIYLGGLINIEGTDLDNAKVFLQGAKLLVLNNTSTHITVWLQSASTITTSLYVSTTGGFSNFVSLNFTQPSNTGLPQGGKLIGSGSVGKAKQGAAVALSADGNTAVIGGPDDNSGVGAVWIYNRTDTTWAQQGSKLVGTGATGKAHQGSSVAISADGNTVIVGGYTDNNSIGAIWIFTRSGNTWAQQGTKKVGTGAVGNSKQGWAVSLSADGNTALVGGYGDNSNKGAVWLFARSGIAWGQQGSKIVGTGAVGGAQQGWAVALSADASTAVVGGNYDNNKVGAAWIFLHNTSAWTQQGTKVLAKGAIGNAEFGAAVAIDGDGSDFYIGGPGDDGSKGAIWWYARSNEEISTGRKKTGSGGSGASRQGESISTSVDGNHIIVGGSADSGGQGCVWIYYAFNQVGYKLIGPGSTGNARQGTSVALSGDSRTSITGGLADNANAGAAWIFVEGSAITRLRSLSFGAGRVAANTPAFSSNVLSYSIYLPRGATTISLTPISIDPNATIIVSHLLNYPIKTMASGETASFYVNPGSSYRIYLSIKSANNTVNTLYTLDVSVSQSTTVSYIQNKQTLYLNKPASVFSTNIVSRPEAFHINKPLPAGLTLNAVTAEISGTPTALSPPTDYKIYAKNIFGGTDTAKINIEVLSGHDADLTSLGLSAGASLSPVFSSDTLSYQLHLDSGITSMTITPTALKSNIIITLSSSLGSESITSGHTSALIPIQESSNATISLKIAHPNGTIKEYSINRISSTDATLSNLTFSCPVILDKPFSKNIYNYTLTIPYTVSPITITPMASVAYSTISVNDGRVISGQASAPIVTDFEDRNEYYIPINVTAQDGLTTKEYMIKIIRTDPENVGISDLHLNSGNLSRLSKDAFTTSVSRATGSVTLATTLVDSNSTLKINGEPIASGAVSPPIILTGETTTINIEVTSHSGLMIRNVTIAINKTGSTNTGINNLRVNGEAPLRVGTTDTFNAGVSMQANTVTLSALTIDTNATIKINGQPVSRGEQSAPINLTGSTTSIIIEITAENGTTKRNITVLVNKTGMRNVSISDLRVNGEAPLRVGTSDTFNAGVSMQANTVTLSALTIDTNATIKINGQPVSRGEQSAPINLTGSTTSIIVEITAEDGTTKRNITVLVNKTGTRNVSISDLRVNGKAPIREGTSDTFVATISALTNSVTLSTVTIDTNAAIKIQAEAVGRGEQSSPITISGTTTNIIVEITAEDGTTTRSINVVVIKPAMKQVLLSNAKIITAKAKDEPIMVHQSLSPNGDGINDHLLIDGIAAVPNNNLTIMNRNGDVIYSAKNYNNNSVMFDGHANNGKLQQPGTYFYTFSYKQNNGTKYKTGYIIIKY